MIMSSVFVIMKYYKVDKLISENVYLTSHRLLIVF